MTRHIRDIPDARAWPDFIQPGDQPRCADHEPDLFHPNVGHPVVALAKAVCGACPLEQPCRGWAVNTDQQHGIWGGTTPAERRQLARRERAQRLGLTGPPAAVPDTTGAAR